MVRKHSNKVLAELKYGSPPSAQRYTDAENDAKEATKLFGNVNVALVGGTNRIAQIIDAIDEENYEKFYQTCNLAGINNPDMIERLWNATFGSLNPQAAKPCW